MQVKAESWVELGKKSETQQEQDFIMESKLFSIVPERGKLEPGNLKYASEVCNNSNLGEFVRIKLSYRFITVNSHSTSVLFQIANGKTIKLNFKGTTMQFSGKFEHS
jgi:hypothetical protein